MNRDILNDYKEKDDKILLAQVLDKIELSEKKNKIEHTDFLNLAQIELVQKFINKIKIENYISYGGFETAERKTYIIYPEKFNPLVVQKNISNIISVIRIQLPDDLKGKYTHRDYLGAVIKLGIKREKVGDIIVDNDGADIIVDKDKFQQIMTNLIENAAKYSNENTTITITTEPAGDYVSIKVTDRGVGILPENYNKIFTKFSRIDNPLTRKVQGSGLGLYITKNLVEKMDGRISVISGDGETTFEILFPVKSVEEQARVKCNR